MDQLHRQLQHLSECRNTVFSPTARLPDDILRLIFSLLPRPNRPQWLWGDNWAWGEDSIVVSHVSRRCRAVSLNTAAPWSQIVLQLPVRGSASPTWHPNYYMRTMGNEYRGMTQVYRDSTKKMTVFLERSKANKLTVDLRIDGGRSLEAYGVDDTMHNTLTSLVYLGRTKNLHVFTDSAGSLSTIVSHLCSASPALRVLRLYLNPTSTPDIQAAELHTMLDRFLDTDMPHLEDITLFCIPLLPRFAALNRCERLVLYIDRNQSLHADWFALFAENCSQLCELDVSLFAPASPSSATEKVIMPCLQSLALRQGLDFILADIRAPRLSVLGIGLVF